MTKMKVAGTLLDRRSKAAFYRKEIVRFYKKGYTAPQLARVYGVAPLQIYRYLNYDKYLERAKKDNAKYILNQKTNAKTKYLYNIKKKWSNKVHDEYIEYLVKCKQEFESKLCTLN